jgi:HSP20 family protein
MKPLAMYHNPIESVKTLVDIDRLVDSFFGNRGLDQNYNLPAVDIRETDSSYIIEAEVPGLNEEDIEVNLNGGTLCIESVKNHTDEKKNDEGNYVIRERRLQSFSRSFKLPDNADTGAIDADFKNGLLSLNVKKRTEAQKRVIDIKKKSA